MQQPATGTQEKKCLECGEPLGAGRDDRKYCGDLCKTAYNNRRRKEPQTTISSQTWKDDRHSFYEKINSIIALNRAIIEHLVETDFRSIEKHDLEGYGFNFKYFTSEYTDPEEGTYRFCYDHGYRIGPDGRRVHFTIRAEEILC